MTPPTVLVVDSDPIMLTAQAALFHQMGAEAICARDMSTARRVFDERTPNLVVCEFSSDSPAAQIWQSWHDELCLDEVPVIFLSDAPRTDFAKTIRPCGWAYYLRRPVDPHLLQELADKLIWMPMQYVPENTPVKRKTTVPPSHLGSVETRKSEGTSSV